jgi:MFS family permease
MPLSLTILTGAFGPQRRGAIIGIWGGLGGLAVAGGPLIGGAVTEGPDWHWIWLNVPVGVAAVALSRARLPESHGPEAGLDLPALALLTGGAASLVWGPGAGERVRLGRADDPRRARLRALLVAGFAAWEGRAAVPMLPLRLLRIRDFTAANATALLMTGAPGAVVFLIAQYRQLVLGYSPLGTGCASSPGRQPPANRSGRQADLRPGAGGAPCWPGAWARKPPGWPGSPGHRHRAAVCRDGGAAARGGAGISMALPTAATAAMSAVRPDQLGKAAGANSTLQRLDSACLPSPGGH